MHPTISVVLTLYNRPQFMAQAIESILGQTLRDLELILIDDGSTNLGVADIAREFEKKDSRVRFFKKKNGGPADARNFGVEKCTAEIIAFCDDDDISEPERLQAQVDFLQNHGDITATTCRLVRIDASGKVIEMEHELTESKVCFCRGPTVVIRRNAFLAIGGFRAWFHAAEDHDFALRFAEKFVAIKLPQRLLRYRRHDSHVSHSIKAWQFFCAAEYSAFCRKAGNSDPITTEAIVEEVITQASSSDFAIRAVLLKNARGQAKRLLRTSNYTEAQEVLCKAKDFFGGDQAGADYADKMRWDVMLWAIFNGRFGFVWVGLGKKK